MKKLSTRQNKILLELSSGKAFSASNLTGLDNFPYSKITINRDIKVLLAHGLVVQVGYGPATKYKISDNYRLVMDVDLEEYFSVLQDDRIFNENFNFEIFNQLRSVTIFSEEELEELIILETLFKGNISRLSETIKKKEFERITIELSWKSSAIEGNTYSLLETESLLKDGREAIGKHRDEAVMILNHKKALDYIRKNKETFKTLKINDIEDIHKILTFDLNVTPNMRETMVGITGTNFKPIDNSIQIREVLEKMCVLINKTENKYSKALFALILIAYIQPFEDGNKRVSRLIANAVLLANDSFPLALRSIDEVEYKEAVLAFYEINNISSIKDLFFEQAQFSAKNYFRV